GRTKAREPKRKLSVPMAVMEKTIPHLHADPARQRVLASLVLAQLYGGMRPGEACAMRPADLDTTRPRAWVYDVGKVSKTLHLDKEQVVFLGPKAQAVIRPHLVECPMTAPAFRLPARRKGERFVRMSVPAYGRYVAAAC